MSTEIWIIIGAGIVFLLGLIYYVVINIMRAKEDFKRIDYSKIKKWEDD